MARRCYILLCVLLAAGVSLPEPAQAQYFRFGKNKVHYEDRTWFYLESRHFTVFHHDGADHLAQFTIRAAEEAYEQVAGMFNFRPRNSLSIIVYEDHGDFSVTNAVNLPAFSDGIGGVTELFKNRIAIPFTGDFRTFRHVIHHELVHAMVNEYFYEGTLQAIISGGPRARIPLWFNEGLAEYAALGWDTRSDMFVREAILSDHLAPIPELRGFFAYRGGQSVWDYVAEQYGEEKIGEILSRLRTMRNVNAAFERSIGLTLEQLSSRWHRALREIHFPEVAARENMGDLGQAVVTPKDGLYNVSPTLSPLGDRVAYVSTTQGLFDVYMKPTDGSSGPVRLIAGQTSRDFEALPILTPGLAWSPDGSRIAVAVRRGEVESIALVDVRTQMVQHLDVPSVEQILSLSWSPTGNQIAMGASNGVQSDIHVLDLTSGAVHNLTNDIFSDHEPSWRPDGGALVFHSDRNTHTRLGRHSASDIDIFQEDFGRYDIYEIPYEASLGSHSYAEARRLTRNTTWDAYSARYGAGNNDLFYIADYNGVPNIHYMDLTSGASRAVTDLDVGVMQIAVSKNGQSMAAVSLLEGVPSIYLLRDMAGRRIPRPAPNIWAQRVAPDSLDQAPVARLAHESLKAQNPFLRNSIAGIAYRRGRDRLLPTADRTPGDSLSLASSDPGFRPEAADSMFGGVRVDFESLRNIGRRPVSKEVQALSEPEENRAYVDENGTYVPRRYKLRFSPDIVTGAAGYDALYGVQGVTQMLFSDMLGDHRVSISTNLLLDLRNSDYIFSYEYLGGRADWAVSTFHFSRLLADFEDLSSPTYFRYRQFGGRVAVQWPLDKFRRIEFETGVLGVSQADITDVARPSRTRTLLVPSLTFTRDKTVPGFLHPVGGSRFAASLSGSPVSPRRDNILFGTVLVDARTYFSAAGNRLVWALRLAGASSFGPDKQVFYSSGVQNWINNKFDDINGFPIEDVTDFVFATPVMPLRGFDINAANGSNFALFNAEFRFPLAASLLPGPLFLSRLHGVTFLDVGGLWGGRGTTGSFQLTSKDVDGRSRLDDLLIGSGFGARTFLLGFPVRVDVAWPFDGISFGERTTHISVGLDF